MPMSLGSPGRGSPAQKGRPSETPWARMLRHPAVWAIVVNNFTFHYAFYVVMNWLPTYFDQVTPAALTDSPNVTSGLFRKALGSRFEFWTPMIVQGQSEVGSIQCRWPSACCSVPTALY